MGGLDEKLGGGIPSGSSVLLISNQEGPVRLFCQQIAFLLANEGHRILYFTIVREPSYIREEMMVYETVDLYRRLQSKSAGAPTGRSNPATNGPARTGHDERGLKGPRVRSLCDASERHTVTTG